MRTFVEKFIDKEELTELDCEFPFYDKNTEDRNEVLIPHSHLSFAQCPSVDIDRVITILNNLKEKGANRVYLADHVDHQGYYVYGTKLIEI